MATPTTTVEIDSELLARLRERRPEQSDRQLLEDLAVIQLGREATDSIRQAFADVPEEEIEREAVRAVHETRRQRAARRSAS